MRLRHTASIPLLSGLILLAILPSCGAAKTGKIAAPQPSVSPPSVAVPSPFKAPPRQESPKPSLQPPSTGAGAARERGGPPPKPASYSAPSGFQNLVLGPQAIRMPEDFDLGPLQNRHAPAESAETARASAAYAFLDALISGALKPELLVPEKADEIKRSLSKLLAPETRLSAFRVGAITSSGDAAHATVFLYAGKARAHGALFLWRSSGSWLIDGLDLDIAALSVPRDDKARRYEATVYRSFYY